MSDKNEIKLINACIRKNKEIIKLNGKIHDLEFTIINLIEVFQILQKHLNFEFAVGVNSNVFMISQNLNQIEEIEYYKLKNAIERYGIK